MLSNKKHIDKKKIINYMIYLCIFLSIAIIPISLSQSGMVTVNSGVTFTSNISTSGNYTSFTESCSTLDNTIWSVYGVSPFVSGGHWTFAPPYYGYTGIVQENHKVNTGYGTYEVIAKTNGVRNNGVNWWIFLYSSTDEFDFMENWGAHPHGEYTISIPTQSSTGGIGYWYISLTSEFGIDIEDGNYHNFTYVYSADDCLIYVDGTKIWQWTIDSLDTSVGLPDPPMQFMIGDKYVSASDTFIFTVDSIKYTAPPPLPPSLNATVSRTFICNSINVTTNDITINFDSPHVVISNPTGLPYIQSGNNVIIYITGTGNYTFYIDQEIPIQTANINYIIFLIMVLVPTLILRMYLGARAVIPSIILMSFISFGADLIPLSLLVLIIIVCFAIMLTSRRGNTD